MGPSIEVRLTGNMKVDASFKGHEIRTDQPKYAGGDDTAPSPYDLFLASLATCSGIFVVFFCQERKIPYEDIVLTMTWDRDADTKLPGRFKVKVDLPAGFPEKYEKALVKVIGQCTVKRTMDAKPEFEVITTRR